MALSKPQLEAMYREIETPLYNFALRWVFDKALAEEVMHEAFVRVWNRRDEVDPATLKGLLYKTVQNVALNEIRRQKIKSALRIVNWFFEDTATPESGMIEEQDLARMRSLLETMPGDLREVLLLSQYSDLSYEEISAALGVPSGTVASRKHRALEWMRVRMEETNG